jgi:hypothetical protein
MENAEGGTTMRGHLIVMAPGLRQTRQLRLNLGVVSGALLSLMCGIFAFFYTFPAEIDDPTFDRMKAENQALRIENVNAGIEAQRLINQIARMERMSSRITRELGGD